MNQSKTHRTLCIERDEYAYFHRQGISPLGDAEYANAYTYDI